MFWLWKKIGFDSALRLWRGIFPLCVFLKALIYLPWRLFERNPQQGSIIGKCQLKILHSSGKIQPLGKRRTTSKLLEFVVAKFQVMKTSSGRVWKKKHVALTGREPVFEDISGCRGVARGALTVSVGQLVKTFSSSREKRGWRPTTEVWQSVVDSIEPLCETTYAICEWYIRPLVRFHAVFSSRYFVFKIFIQVPGYSKMGISYPDDQKFQVIICNSTLIIL